MVLNQIMERLEKDDGVLRTKTKILKYIIFMCPTIGILCVTSFTLFYIIPFVYTNANLYIHLSRFVLVKYNFN